MYEAQFKTLRSQTARLQATSVDAALAEAHHVAAERSTADETYHLTGLVNRETGQITQIPAGGALPPPGEVDVIWRVRLRADSGEHAASLARLMQFDPTSIASVYRTCDSRGNCEVIDLQNAAAAPH